MGKPTVKIPQGWPEPLNVQFTTVEGLITPVSDLQMFLDIRIEEEVRVIAGVYSSDPAQSFDFDVADLPKGVWGVDIRAISDDGETYPLGSLYLNVYGSECDCNGGC